MRKGKKLFGKINVFLYIFKLYMEYVFDCNVDCFDFVYDKFCVFVEF